MKRIERAVLIDRHQAMFLSPEDIATEESMVRNIDRFIGVCDLAKMNVKAAGKEMTGRLGVGAAAFSRL